jgi:hypothetical protein
MKLLKVERGTPFLFLKKYSQHSILTFLIYVVKYSYQNVNSQLFINNLIAYYDWLTVAR